MKIMLEVLSRIEGPGFLENKASHNEHLKRNPFAARRNATGEYALISLEID